MAITAAQKFLLNHMNSTASKVLLGDLIEDAEGGGVGAGDIGTTELADGSVTTAKLAAGAVVSTELTLTHNSILIGDSGGVGSEVVPSGDWTIADTGVNTIGAKKVTAAKTACADGKIFIGGVGGAAAEQTLSGDVTITNAGVASVAALAINNAKISATAAIAFTKLAALTSGNILVGSAGNVVTEVTMSGDATIIASGALTIANLAVTNAKVSATAAIAFSKLATLTSGNILVGSAGNVATAVAMSGDATIIASGAITIANSAVTTAKINAAAVTVAKLDPAVMLEATGTLSRTNLLAMNATPVELIAAPGAGLALIIDEIELFHDFDTAAYTAGGVLVFEYGDGTDLIEAAASIVTGAADTKHIIRPSAYALDATTGTGVGFSYAATVNQNFRITNLTAAFASGNSANIVKWRIRYHTVTAIT